MGRIWSQEHTFELWLRVEMAVAEAWATLGRIPAESVQELRHASFDVQRVVQYEEQTQHDLIAFLQSVRESTGSAGKYLHIGLTSSDVKDTALSIQMAEAIQEIVSAVQTLRAVIGRLALRHRDTVMMGRTHGIQAEPTTFGFKLAVWYDDLSRSLDGLRRVEAIVSVAKLAGAVGTHADIPPQVEELAAEQLGLNPAPAETQVIQRDRHARFILELALLGGTLDKIATEIRGLQRTEVGEVREPFGARQKGSSAMPHKRNPIGSERITGIARLLRGYTVPVLEDIALWHERDMSHSVVERVVLGDASALADYGAHLLTGIIEHLEVFPERMKENIEATHEIAFSHRALERLISGGLPPNEAYDVVQEAAFRAQDQRLSLSQALRESPDVLRLLGEEGLQEIFDFSYFTRHIDDTFKRVGLVSNGSHELASVLAKKGH